MSGLWCCNAGHCRAPIVEALQKQIATLDYARAFQLGHAPAFRLASKLSGLAPGDLNHVFFCNSGSEAVDTALKIALAYHKLSGQSTRTRFIGRERGYHGAYFGGTSVGGIPQNRNLFEPLLRGRALESVFADAVHGLQRTRRISSISGPSVLPPASTSRPSTARRACAARIRSTAPFSTRIW